MKQLKQQHGGTFLGLILGLVVGLALALGVAMYVTKVPTPLSNKNLPRSAEQDAAESEKNKTWNPNGALQPKPALPAPTASEPTAPAEATGVAPAPASAPAPVPAPASPPVVAPNFPPHAEIKPSAPAAGGAAPAPRPAPALTKPAESKEAKEGKEPKDSKSSSKESKPAGSADPLGDLAKSRAAQAESREGSKATPDNAFSYVVQVGAYRQEADAQAQKAKMALMGFDARVSERDLSGGKVYRVRLGPFSEKDSAERVRAKLQAVQIEGTLVRIER